MNIRTKLILIGVFAASIVLVFGSVIVYIQYENSILENKKNHAETLVLTIFERNIFFSDYLFERSDRAKQQLVARNHDIEKHVTAMQALLTNQKERDMIRRLKDENYTPISVNIERLLAQEEEFSPTLRSLIISDIFVKSQSSVGIIQQLEQVYQKRIEDLRITLNVIMVSFGLLIFLFGLVSFIIISSILRSLAKLNKGVREIAKGNLTYRVNIQTRDELGVLGSVFNDMAVELKASYAKLNESKKFLEDRVRAQTKELTQKIVLLERFKAITEDREHKMIELKRTISSGELKKTKRKV